MTDVSVVCMGPHWLMGKIKKINGTALLYDPRVYFFNGQSHAIMSLPGDPESINVDKCSFYYTLNQCEALSLYTKHTTVIDVVEAPRVII